MIGLNEPQRVISATIEDTPIEVLNIIEQELSEMIGEGCSHMFISALYDEAVKRGDSLTDRGKGNTCGNQYSPSLLRYGDIPDVAGLIAPRPLLVEMGEKDECFVIEDAARAYEHVQRET